MSGIRGSLLFGLLFALAGYVGRLTIIDQVAVALVWPAAGVAVVWLLARSARPLSLDTLLLAVATYAVNALTGSSATMSLVFVVANVVQVWVIVVLMRRWTPELWGCGGTEPLGSNRQLGRLLLAATIGTVAGVGIGSLGLLLTTGGFTLEQGLVWWGRNLCGVLVVGSLGLVLGQRIVRGPRLGRVDVAGREVESVAIFVVSGVLYQVAFVADLPLAFPLLVTTVWAGLRISTVLVTVHSLVVGVTAVAYTLQGHGPFVAVGDGLVGALLAQVFVGMIVTTGLTLAIGRDERVRLADELRASQRQSAAQAELFSTVVGSVAEGIIVVAGDGDRLVTNRAARDILGLSVRSSPVLPAGTVILQPDGTPIPPDRLPSARALRGERVPEQDLLLRDGSRHDRTVAVSATPLPDGDGVPRAVVVLRDVTDERARTRELASFAGVVAHDLRNPIGVIGGWVEALDGQYVDQLEDGAPVDPVAARGVLERVRGASDRMQHLIEDLLAHATASDRALRPVDVDLGDLVRDAVAARGVAEQVTVGDLPAVRVDVGLVRQLLDNLLGNALKYVAPGVAPRIVVEGCREDEVVTVRVADNGIGIPEGQHELVFEQFHRAHAASYTGTGLGLAICKRIVERHGGDISVAPGPGGRGSVFAFTLPAASDERPGVPLASPAR